MEYCKECSRLQDLLQESGIEYLAAANRYNTLLFTQMDSCRAAAMVFRAKTANDELQRQFNDHVKAHSVPSRAMAAGM